MAKMTFGNYMRLQMEEMQSAKNRWYAGIALGKDPSPEEAAMHYATGIGAVNFNEKFAHLLNEDSDS